MRRADAGETVQDVFGDHAAEGWKLHAVCCQHLTTSNLVGITVLILFDGRLLSGEETAKLSIFLSIKTSPAEFAEQYIIII